MSPLYAWERSTWDSHPSRVLRPSCARRPRRLALRISTLLAASFNPLPSASSLAPSVIPSQVSIRPIFRLLSIYLSFSLSIPPFAALPRRVSAGTHTRRSEHTANRKLNSRQRARRAWSQLRGARGTKLNDRDVFRLLQRRSYGECRRTKWDRYEEGEKENVSVYIY